MKTIVNGLTLEQIATLEDQHELTRAAYANGLAAGWAERTQRCAKAVCVYCVEPTVFTLAKKVAGKPVNLYYHTDPNGRLHRCEASGIWHMEEWEQSQAALGEKE